MNLQTKGAQSDHDEWDADKERMHGPSGNLVTISDGAGREVEMTSDELEDFESETGLTVAEDEVSPVRFDSLLAWLRENELLAAEQVHPDALATALAALESISTLASNCPHDQPEACNRELEKIMSLARAAIAKATGGAK